MSSLPDFLVQKEKYLRLPASEKKKNGLSTLSNIPTWTQYFEDNKERLKSLNKTIYKSSLGIEDHRVNEDFCNKVCIFQGDITTLDIDAIVNAANTRLLGGVGAGVDGVIHRAAGEFLKSECRSLNGCETGDAKITGGYQLPAKYVIHTAGPVGEMPSLLESSYKNSLEVAVENDLRTIAFPCISTGAYGYPQDKAANIALKTIRQFLETHPFALDRVVLCLFVPKDVEIYEHLMQLYFPTPE